MAENSKPRKQPTLRARAIGMLARREFPRAELRDRLLATGAEREEVDALLDVLAADGYLSDARYANALVRQKSRGYSLRSIAHSLKSKGVASEAATDALAGAEQDDQTTMVALWQRRFGVAPANDREKARQVRFLQSRGFGLSAIFKLLRDPPVEP